MRGNRLKTRLAKGGVVFGTMVFEFDRPGLAKIVAAAGAAGVVDPCHFGLQNPARKAGIFRVI